MCGLIYASLLTVFFGNRSHVKQCFTTSCMVVSVKYQLVCSPSSWLLLTWLYDALVNIMPTHPYIWCWNIVLHVFTTFTACFAIFIFIECTHTIIIIIILKRNMLGSLGFYTINRFWLKYECFFCSWEIILSRMDVWIQVNVLFGNHAIIKH